MALTTISPALQDTQAQYTGFKNRIINGAMMIDQRNAGASVAWTNQVYPVDRFSIAVYQTVLTGTLQQVSTAPAGFSKSTCITITTGQALSSTDINAFRQVIEGNNLADFSYGTASAATSTLSFWVRSSVTGQFTVAIYNPTAAKWYSQPYTINSANTWEYKTVTVIGDTASAMATNNGQGLLIDWVIGAGSSYNGAASQTWGASNPRQITGSTNITTVSGATFYITGVQLEKGSTATSFDYRPYGTELALCQRYCYGWYAMAATTGLTIAGATAGLYSDANVLGMLSLGLQASSMRDNTALSVATYGIQGTDWGVYSSGAVIQTGFTIAASKGGTLSASKTAHGLTGAFLGIAANNTTGKILITSEL